MEKTAVVAPIPSARVSSPAVVNAVLRHIMPAAYRMSLSSVSIARDYTDSMARRGLSIVFTLLGLAVFISIAGFTAMYLLFGREPAVPSNATLVLKVGGSLTELAPADVVGYLRGSRTPTVRSIVDNLRKAKVDPRVKAVLLKPTGFESPFWAKVQEVRDAVI